MKNQRIIILSIYQGKSQKFPHHHIFHFKGYYQGKRIEQVLATLNLKESDLHNSSLQEEEEYLLDGIVNSYQKSTLFFMIFRARAIKDLRLCL